jgi:hypothetical protein
MPRALDPDFVLEVGRTDKRRQDQAVPEPEPPADDAPPVTTTAALAAMAPPPLEAATDDERPSLEAEFQALPTRGRQGALLPAPAAAEGGGDPTSSPLETTPATTDRTSSASGRPAPPRPAPRRTGRPHATPRRSVTAKAASRFRDTPTPSPASGTTLQRSYVLDEEHDELLRNAAAISGLTINQVVQNALAAHLGDLDEERLLTATDAPLSPGGEPPQPRRRTLMILADHDRLLRILRLRFSVQSSDVVRQALDALRPR